jgi:hypothetical protein
MCNALSLCLAWLVFISPAWLSVVFCCRQGVCVNAWELLLLEFIHWYVSLWSQAKLCQAFRVTGGWPSGVRIKLEDCNESRGMLCVCACYVKIDCAQLKLCVYCTQELNQHRIWTDVFSFLGLHFTFVLCMQCICFSFVLCMHVASYRRHLAVFHLPLFRLQTFFILIELFLTKLLCPCRSPRLIGLC